MQTIHILVVDDEEPLRFALREFLTNAGFEVECAEELEEAQALLSNRHFDAVVVDLKLTPIQGAEGLQVITFIRERALPTRIVVLTAADNPAIMREALRLGVDAFMQKPARLALLAKTIRQVTGETP